MPSGFLVVFEKPNRSSFTFSFTLTFTITLVVYAGSGGDGAFHGGDGVVREVEFRSPMTLSVLSERRSTQPYGLFVRDTVNPLAPTLPACGCVVHANVFSLGLSNTIEERQVH
jgi:hypothetical protein